MSRARARALKKRGTESIEERRWALRLALEYSRDNPDLVGKEGTQQEIAEALGMSRQWVTDFDLKPDTYHKTERLPQHSNLFKSNVWGLNEETTLNQPDKVGLQGKIASADPEQPDRDLTEQNKGKGYKLKP
jgi:transcriptional regulator with XRE-family HTH domain